MRLLTNSELNEYGTIIGGGRNLTIDISRGIAMLLVIFQHCGAFSQYVLSFHMPLFFIIGGLTMRGTIPNTSFMEEVKKNFLRLMVPQCMIGLFECVFIIIREYYETGIAYALTFPDMVHAIFRWWFLLVLFQSRLLIWIYRKYFIGHCMKAISFIVVLIGLTVLVELK